MLTSGLLVRSASRQAGQTHDRTGMKTSDRSHVDQLSFYKLNAVVFTKNSSLSHLVEIMGREEMSNGFPDWLYRH